MKEKFDNLKYNSCVSKGICSINPRISALQNVLVLFLHLCSKYCLKLFEKGVLSGTTKDFILNTVAISIANPEFSENCYIFAINGLKEALNEVISLYNQAFGCDEFNGENIFESDLFRKSENLSDAIKMGENIFRESVSKISNEVRDLYKIVLIISKSASINLLDLKSYGCDDEAAFETVLKMINSMNSGSFEAENLKQIIYDGAECNTNLMRELHKTQEEKYGKQGIYSVSYSTTPSKALLVVGSNIIELEMILEALKNTDIDVYTHDDMMVAHTFPKFKEYKNLKGQYGYGVENCLVDFATFPGPIILTKHSLHNVENLYRGRLFTTDRNYYKGIIRIKDNDFDSVIRSANESKGFKRGKVCESVEIGYDYENSIELINEKIKSGKFKKIVVIGLKEYSDKYEEYFEKLIKLLKESVLIISFSYNFKSENSLFFNACFDSYAVVRICQHILNYGLPVTVFLPKCGRNTVAEVLHFKRFEGVNVFIGECEPVILNPSLTDTLRKVFDIKTMGSPQGDAEFLNKL